MFRQKNSQSFMSVEINLQMVHKYTSFNLMCTKIDNFMIYFYLFNFSVSSLLY